MSTPNKRIGFPSSGIHFMNIGTSPEQEARERVRNAAPLLLDALQGMVECCEETLPAYAESGELSKEIANARAAIARATQPEGK